MKTKPLYITVKLEIEYEKDLNFEDIKDDVIENMEYDFSYYKIENEEVKYGILDTEIMDNRDKYEQ